MPSRSKKAEAGSKKKRKLLPFALTQRLAYIEEVLFWVGEVARFHLQDQFRISPQRAALDFAAYRKLHPSHLHYDSAIKRYVPTERFVPSFYVPDIDRALPRWATVESVPQFERSCNVGGVRILVAAIRRNRRCRLLYRSLNSESTSYREVSAHTFVNDGARWHVRVFDHTSSKWCDLVLGRIESVELMASAARPAAEDEAWVAHVKVQAKPSRALKPAAQKALSDDYRMSRGVLTTEVRKALSFYVAVNLGLLRFDRARFEPTTNTRAFLREIRGNAGSIE